MNTEKTFILLISVYVEFGNTATDKITVTNTWRSGGLTTAKTYNILLRQISCTSSWK